MENKGVYKYYEKINEEISRLVKPMVFANHNCNYSYYDNNGNLIVIKTDFVAWINLDFTNVLV